MSDLLAQAFTALGQAPTRRELELVANTLRESGDEDALAELDAACDREGFHQLVELALASGASGFVALDLRTEFAHPGTNRRGR